MRREPTDVEIKLWNALRDRQLEGYKFRRQVPVAGFIADFMCKDAALIVEVDGGQHAENAGRDEKRTKILNGEGFRVVRFWNNEVLQNLDGVLQELLRELRATPSPRPSPPMGAREQ